MSKNQGLTGDFQPIMGPLVRLLAGSVVLFVLQTIILGFPGIASNIANTTITMASVATVTIGAIAAVVVLKFGTQLADAAGDAYRSVKAYMPVLAYFFQLAAIWIMYIAFKGISANFFTASPWAYPLIFLVLAIIPTMKVVVNVVRAMEGQPTARHVTRDQF